MSKAQLFSLVMFLLSISSVALAQGPGGGPGGGGGSSPIDGGASIFLAGVAAYGVKKIRDNRKKNKAEKEI